MVCTHPANIYFWRLGWFQTSHRQFYHEWRVHGEIVFELCIDVTGCDVSVPTPGTESSGYLVTGYTKCQHFLFFSSQSLSVPTAY